MATVEQLADWWREHTPPPPVPEIIVCWACKGTGQLVKHAPDPIVVEPWFTNEIDIAEAYSMPGRPDGTHPWDF